MTSFPPPPGFDGYEKRRYGGWGYERECTAEEAELLDAAEGAADAEELAEAEALRDAWFGMLRSELTPARNPGLEPGPASPSPVEEETLDRFRDETQENVESVKEQG